MNVYLADLKRTPDRTYADDYHPVFTPVALMVADQVSRVIAGEATPEQAVQQIRADAGVG